MGLRGYSVYTVTIASGAAIGTTIVDENGNPHNAIPLAGHALGYVIMPTTWTAANLGIKVAATKSGTAADYVLLLNENGALDEGADMAVAIANISTSVAYAYTMPPRWADVLFGRLVSLNTSTDAEANQAGARTIYVCLKV